MCENTRTVPYCQGVVRVLEHAAVRRAEDVREVLPLVGPHLRHVGVQARLPAAVAGATTELDQQLAAVGLASGLVQPALMHILAGLDRPTSGTVSIGGVDLTGLPDRELTQLRRDRIGFIFQTFNLLPVLNARENILLPLSIAGRKPDDAWFDLLIDTV